VSSQFSLDEIKAAVNAAYDQFRPRADGKNASYIPYLAKVPATLFGIAVVTTDGQVLEAGDTRYAFAIESISKVFNLALVIEQIGPVALRQKIGADPTGEPFNSVMAIELHRGKPLNPFVNAGAIATVSLIQALSAEDRWQKMIDTMSRFAGRALTVNQEVYSSETKSNQHNRGIAWLWDSYGFMYSDVASALDLYTRGCSVEITAVDLATMGATLANGGVNPSSREQPLGSVNVPKILTEMTMNGLYDSTGDWQYKVGLPGKSGVGGGVLAVAPGKLAIGVFAPPLDLYGNSVRGQLAAQHLSQGLGLNIFAP
jgi:glutaminase